MPRLKYPVTRQSDHRDHYFGHAVADPYQWLEDDHAEETLAWVTAQNAVTEAYLQRLPARETLRDRLTELWDYPKRGMPQKHNGQYFFFKNDGLQQHHVLYIQSGLDAEPEILLDPNTFSEDGSVALATYSISADARYLAYGVSQSGSDWIEIRVLDIASRTLLDDRLQWIKFSGADWLGEGFFYTGYDQPLDGSEFSAKNQHPKIYYHRLGTPQSTDQLIREDPAVADKIMGISVSEDETVLSLFERLTGQDGYALAVKRPDAADWCWINEDHAVMYRLCDNLGSTLLVMSNDGAARWQLLAIDLDQPQREHWRVLIPEQVGVMRHAGLAGDKLFVFFTEDAYTRVRFYQPDGTYLYDLDLPDIGTVGSIAGRWGDDELFYSFTSYLTPPLIYRYSVAANRAELLHQSGVDFDATAYETHQHFYTSKDGTRVPMFLVHRKGLQRNGQNPVYLYGYGGFNVSLTPGFDLLKLPLLEQGVVIAIANLRGGGEYGEDWHQGGTRFNKQNVFDDFIAAAEYLIAEQITCPDRLAIAGGSNGGLLIGACMTQRPELFRVALPSVGVMDMLKYHQFTIGWAWKADYGSSEDSEDMFQYLLGYSPLHNLREGVAYPATLVSTADHDDRVVPAHSFKFAATLQAKYQGERPMLIQIHTKAGHGAGRATTQLISEAADELAFLLAELGVS